MIHIKYLPFWIKLFVTKKNDQNNVQLDADKINYRKRVVRVTIAQKVQMVDVSRI